MIEFYAWPTPNGFKISIMLEEIGLPYTVHPIDIGKGDQFAPDFLRISPNNKIPAIVDTEGPGGNAVSVFESGAILIYLAEKTEKLLPRDGADRYAVLEWLMFQMGGIGPMLGQAHHFRLYAPEPGWRKLAAQIAAGCLLMAGAVLVLRHVLGPFTAMHWGHRIGWLVMVVAAGAAAYALGLWLAGLRPRHLREA